MRRDWSLVDAKRRLAASLGCRSCGRAAIRLQGAHTIGRARDDRAGVVRPQDIVFLCAPCHALYDTHRLDLYPVMSPEERRAAVLAAGGAGHALRRLSGPLWRQADQESVKTIDERLRELMPYELGVGG